MNAPGVSKLSPAKPLRGVSIPLVDGLGEVRVERLEDGAVRITDSINNLTSALEFSFEEWQIIVEVMMPLRTKPRFTADELDELSRMEKEDRFTLTVRDPDGRDLGWPPKLATTKP